MLSNVFLWQARTSHDDSNFSFVSSSYILIYLRSSQLYISYSESSFILIPPPPALLYFDFEIDLSDFLYERIDYLSSYSTEIRTLLAPAVTPVILASCWFDIETDSSIWRLTFFYSSAFLIKFRLGFLDGNGKSFSSESDF